MFPDVGGSLEEDPEFQLGSSRQNSFFCSYMTEVSAHVEAPEALTNFCTLLDG